MSYEGDLFERDGFTETRTMKWQGKTLTFTQWEARYVSELEYENKHFKDLVLHLRTSLDRERNKYIDLFAKSLTPKEGERG